jgi:transposase-like protein
MFAARWQVFCRENFEGPAQVARAFGVDRTTAENWWRGLNAPQGWAVGLAVSDPQTGAAARAAIGGET